MKNRKITWSALCANELFSIRILFGFDTTSHLFVKYVSVSRLFLRFTLILWHQNVIIFSGR